MTQFSLVALVTVGLSAVTMAGAETGTRRDAARLQAKLEQIAKNGSGSQHVPGRTSVSEAEVNAYLQYELTEQIPKGVKDPRVTIVGPNRMTGNAVVDLTQVAQSRKSGGLMDPWNLVGGTLPVEVHGILKTQRGSGTFTVESASISGVPVPVWMLQEIVTYYTKSPIAPNGVAIDKPFPLPVGVQEIALERGQAVVVQ